MVDKLRPVDKHRGTTSILLTGAMFFALSGISKGNGEKAPELYQAFNSTSEHGWKVTETNQIDDKLYNNFSSNYQQLDGGDGGNNAISFAVDNISQYYPDMKEHLDSLVSSFWDQEQRDTVNFLLQQNILQNITGEKNQVAAIIYCIENFVFKGSSKIKKTFSEKYDIGDVVDDDHYVYFINFNKGYNKWFKGYFKRLETILADMNKTIDQNTKTIDDQKKQIEGIVNTFTANDVRSNPAIKQLVLEAESLYIKDGFVIFPHLKDLIRIARLQ